MFKKIMILVLAVSFSACTDLAEVKIAGIDGVNGVDGVNGTNGADGYSSLISISTLNSESEVCQSGSGILLATGLDTNRNSVLEPEEMNESSIAVVCNGLPGAEGPQGPVGPAGADGANGEDGSDGTNGSDGQNGSDGVSCTLQDTEEGAIVTCGDTSTTIYDGQNGTDGTDGTDGQDGSDGEDGEDGEDASAILSSYTLSTSCQSVGNGFYAKKFGTTAKIYTDNDCDDKVADLVENSDEVYFSSNIMFIVEEGPSSVKLFKVIF